MLGNLRNCGLAFMILFPLLIAGTGKTYSAEQKTANIGVLAFRGDEAAIAHWTPLADYLSASVDGWKFELVPVSQKTVGEQIDANRLAFLITNPGHFVSLANKHRLSAIATRDRWAARSGKYLSSFGTAIVVRAGSNIISLNDLRDRKIAAVAPEAFGGFQIAWSELRKHGVDIFHDLKSLQFLGFPQDQILTAVHSGDVDAGIVRSGLLETLDTEGKISIDEFRVLNTRTRSSHPHMASGDLFPEWPFATFSNVDKKLQRDVALALLTTQNPQIGEKYKLIDLWSVPDAYDETRVLIRSYAQHMQASKQGKLIGFDVFNLLAVITSLLILGALVITVYLRRRPVTLASSADVDGEDLTAYRERFTQLTQRENEILSLACSGLQNKEIARQLNISPKTVEFHRTNLLQKTHAGTTAHLVQIATRLKYELGSNPREYPRLTS